jgi:membrane protease subunit (stomatin/prohibitin family)
MIKSVVEISNQVGQINIKKLLNQLESIGNEKEKEEFIKNYSRIKEEIKITDSILNGEISNMSDNTNIDMFESKTIDELLELLEQSENKIFNSNDELTVNELKSLNDMCMVLENKLNTHTMNIIEIK